MPGTGQQPTSILNRISTAIFHFNVAHRQQPRWAVQPSSFSAAIKARYRRNGFRPTPFYSNPRALPKNIELDFEVLTNVPKPYKVYWQVVNTGDEAYRAGQLRGDFYDSSSSGRNRTESTMYKGTHWVEGFVVKGNICVARTGEFVVNIG
jgi:hypothetical protein